MKYYSSFSSSEKNLQGIFTYVNTEFGYVTIDNSENIILIEGNKNINRIFNNNSVEVEIIDNITENVYNFKENYKIIGKGCIKNLLDDNDNLYLSGVLFLNSKIAYGSNKKNNPFYEFKPSNNKYPSFIVSSSYKRKNDNSKNIYILIKFKEWNERQKKPIGICEKIIGEVGILQSEYENILYKYNLNFCNYKKKEIEKYQHYYSNYYENNTDFDRIDYSNENIFSIDPPGCKDIDDAIHFNLQDDIYYVYIHIADVSHFVLEGSYLDIECQKRLQSIYSPHKIINMIPGIYANDICSLKPNEIRKAFTLKIGIDSNLNIISQELHKSLIKSKKAMSYEEAEKIINDKNINSELNRNLLELYCLIKDINELYFKKEIFDTHVLIEILMIMTNKIVAEQIYNFNKNNCILRLHNKKEFLETDRVTDKDLLSYLEIVNSESAVYKSLFEDDNIYHYGINCKYYTHFTSPIRRYADIIVHRIVSNMLLSQKEYNDWGILCEKMNLLNNSIKKSKREIEKIDFINQNFNNEIVEAFITDIIPSSNKIQIFIKDNKMSFRIKIFSEKLVNLIYCNFTDKSFEISYKEKDKKYTFNLLDKIKLLVTTRIEANNIDKKCIISILDDENLKIIDLLL